MEINKIKNIKEREKFILLKDFRDARSSQKRIKLSCITKYYVKESSLIIHQKDNLIDSFNYKSFEDANKALDKIDEFFHISKI